MIYQSKKHQRCRSIRAIGVTYRVDVFQGVELVGLDLVRKQLTDAMQNQGPDAQSKLPTVRVDQADHNTDKRTESAVETWQTQTSPPTRYANLKNHAHRHTKKPHPKSCTENNKQKYTQKSHTQLDRHQCFKPGNTQKIEGGKNYLILVTFL